MRPKHPIAVLAVFACLLSPACAVETADLGSEHEPDAKTSSAACRNALSSSEERTALKLIDDICGDTWCEGDNNFAFDHVTCRAATAAAPGTCTLKLRIFPRDDSGRAFPRSCTTGAFRGFASLVETSSSGYQSLNWDYYLALTDCISELEAELPR